MDASLLIVFLSTLTVTSYRPVASQTDNSPSWTSIGDRTTKYGVAVSEDLLRSGIVKYGDVLDVPGFGLRVVNDVMGPTRCAKRNEVGRCVKRIPQVKAIDLLVFTHKEESKVGVRKLPITRYRQRR